MSAVDIASEGLSECAASYRSENGRFVRCDETTTSHRAKRAGRASGYINASENTGRIASNQRLYEESRALELGIAFIRLIPDRVVITILPSAYACALFDLTELLALTATSHTVVRQSP